MKGTLQKSSTPEMNGKLQLMDAQVSVVSRVPSVSAQDASTPHRLANLAAKSVGMCGTSLMVRCICKTIAERMSAVGFLTTNHAILSTRYALPCAS